MYLENSSNLYSVNTETNLSGFSQEIDNLREEVVSSLSQSDFKHLLKIEWFGRISTLIGIGTAWIFPNPITAFLISLGQFTRWLMAHHILHKGYDKVPGVPARYTSSNFARGWRRYVDWFDWFVPEAWDYEHNQLHHYHTGENDDPDLVERHLRFLRELKVPYFIKYIFVIVASLTWKYTYYAPNTMSVIHPSSRKRLKKEHIAYITIKNIFQFSNKHVRKLWLDCYLPYATYRFVLIPLLFLPLGKTAVLYAFINMLLAECITNMHSFLVIGPNHTAEDLYRYDFHYENKDQFYVTQIMGSANYNCGDEFTDYMSIWLNYQIEHHLFPDLPMSKYREIQPKVKALCAKYKIPYRQESIFKRFGKMLDVTVGKAKMPELRIFSKVL